MNGSGDRASRTDQIPAAEAVTADVVTTLTASHEEPTVAAMLKIELTPPSLSVEMRSALSDQACVVSRNVGLAMIVVACIAGVVFTVRAAPGQGMAWCAGLSAGELALGFTAMLMMNWKEWRSR
ncbi:MAG TPA: hypothetical protein VGH27_32860 [Streptosporangiaceae bacterium]|jgi:hypothetical protein